MKNIIKILAINPGSTSTKVALYGNREQLFEDTIRHAAIELAECGDTIYEQYAFRLSLIVDLLAKWQQPIEQIDVVMGRGGLLRPIESGVYEVNDALADDLRKGYGGEHASNLGGILARELAVKAGCKAYIADPVVVDELSDVARVGGHPLFPRRSVFHALNQKAVAKEYAAQKGKEYADLNLIVVHMGGGVSVGAHKGANVIDVNNALDGQGAFSPERSGTMPAGDLLRAAFSGNYTYSQLYRMVVGKGGFSAHLGTTDVKDIVERAQNGDKDCSRVIDAFCYNVAKSVAAMAIPLSFKVDSIILTGGIAYSDYICSKIVDMISPIAPVHISAGEDEMAALAMNGYQAYHNPSIVKIY